MSHEQGSLQFDDLNDSIALNLSTSLPRLTLRDSATHQGSLGSVLGEPRSRLPVGFGPGLDFRELSLVDQPLTQMPGVRCPRCAERGIEQWVLPGKHCPRCDQPC